MRAAGPESNRAEYACHERHIVVPQIDLAEFAGFMKRGNHIEAQDVSFTLLHAVVNIEQCLSYRSFVVNRILDAKPMCHFMKHRVGEEGLGSDMISLRFVNKHIRDRAENFFELRLDRVLELQAASSFLQLHLFVVGKVDRDCLRASVAVARVINNVISIEIGICSRSFLLVFIGNRQPSLQIGQEIGKPLQALAPVPVFYQHIGLVSSLITVQPVLIVFDGSDDDIDWIGFDVHPDQIAGLIIVCNQRVRPGPEIIPEALVLRKTGSLLQEICGLAQFIGVSFVIGNDNQGAVGVTT